MSALGHNAVKTFVLEKPSSQTERDFNFFLT